MRACPAPPAWSASHSMERSPAAEGALLVRGDAHPFALAGDWAGGGALVGSEPLVVAGPEEDPFELLDRQPAGDRRVGSEGVGGGWFGYLGYNLGARLERIPPPPPRRVPLPDFALAFYDHLLHLDADGRWWFEALWTDERADVLSARLDLFRARLADGSPRAARVGRQLPARAARRDGARERDRRVPRADRRRRDLPGEPLPAARGGVEGRPARPVRPHGRDARAAPRGRRRGTVGSRLQPLPRAVPAPPRPRGGDRADQGNRPAHRRPRGPAADARGRRSPPP